MLDRLAAGSMSGVDDARLSIGEFSKMTYLSVKALRHYHDVGLLEPAAVDPSSGYRSYAATQVQAAQAIRRFRELDMPIEHIREVLHAPDPETRDRAILQHLERMQAQLDRTQRTVASLQALLQDRTPTGTVEHRSVGSHLTLSITEDVAFADAGAWCDVVLAELRDAMTAAGIAPAGADGALYSDAFFEEGTGPVTAFVPIPTTMAATGRLAVLELPPSELAVLVHEGSFDELDQAYGALGTYVAARRLSAGGPIREHYLADDRTEVCWPIVTPS